MAKAALATCCLALALDAQQPATSGQSGQEAKPPAPYIVSELLPGMTQIHGRMSAVAEGQAVSVRLYVNQQLHGTGASVNGAAGEFSFQLPQGLRANDSLQVQQVVAGVESPRSPVKTVPDVVPKISPAPQEGDKQVAGTAQKGVETVEVTVTDKAGAAKETAKGKIDGEGKFEVSLQAALAAGDQVSVRVPGGSASPAIRVQAKEEKQLQITSIAAYQGDTKVTVFFEPIPGAVESASLQVESNLETKKVTLTADQRKENKVEVTLGRVLMPPADPKSSQRLLCPGTTPPSEYPAGGMVKVTLSGSGKGITVKQSCREDAVTPPTLSLTSIPLYEGDQVVEGKALPNVKKVAITVHQGVAAQSGTNGKRLDEIREAEKKLAQQKDRSRAKVAMREVQALRLEILPITQKVEAAVAENKFTTKLGRRLAAGEWVTIQPLISDPVGGERVGAEGVSERVRSALLDWGRFRAVFTTGAAISDGSESSSSVDPYVGFTADGQIAGKLLDKEALSTADPEFPGIIFRDNRWSLHTFVDARLTQATKAEAPAATTTPESTGDKTDEPVKATPVSASLFQFGAYLPVSFKGTDWVYEGTQYSFFFAPLFKAGWQTLDDGVPVEFVTTVKGTGMEQTTDKKVTDERKGLLPFWGCGLRFGFQKFDLMGSDYRNRQVSTDLIGYLDLTIGKHAAYRTYFPGAPVAGSDVTTTTTTSRLDNRIALEARLKIPFTPAFIGVDANMNTDGRDREPNDVRFLVGFRIDANKALGKVFGDVK